MHYVLLAAIGGLLGALLLGAAFAFQKQSLPGGIHVIFVLLLLAPIPFCLFGFAASFEPSAYNWVWRIGYAAIIVACVGAIIRLCWPRSSNLSEDRQAKDS